MAATDSTPIVSAIRLMDLANLRQSENQSTSAGATTTAPAKSPIHQVIHTAANDDQLTKPPTASAQTPMVALIGALMTPRIARKAPIPHGVLKARTPSTHRFSRSVAVSASSMLPAPIAREVARDPAVLRFAATAPTRIAGQMRQPLTSIRPTARPVGGQIGVALGLIEANRRLSFAVRKYRAARAAASTR